MPTPAAVAVVLVVVRQRCRVVVRRLVVVVVVRRVVVLVVGYMMTLGRRLLPDRVTLVPAQDRFPEIHEIEVMDGRGQVAAATGLEHELVEAGQQRPEPGDAGGLDRQGGAEGKRVDLGGRGIRVRCSDVLTQYPEETAKGN